MENTKIEWCDATFNPWWGCMKVSQGCANCFAEALDNRWKGGHWGPGSDRKPMGEKYWAQPLAWNEQARKSGKPYRVFCGSMCDWAEGHPQTLEHLARLFLLIEATPYLTWQMLTKRPENVLHLVPTNWLEGFPLNVWMGTSIENDQVYDRIEHLVMLPAFVRFLSCEPLLGPITLPVDSADGSAFVEWVIAGGESGPGARPMHPDWARSLRDQCSETGTAFFFKQFGEYIPACQTDYIDVEFREENTKLKRQFPSPHNPEKMNTYYKVGKKVAGSRLDGQQWKQFP